MFLIAAAAAAAAVELCVCARGHLCFIPLPGKRLARQQLRRAPERMETSQLQPGGGGGCGPNYSLIIFFLLRNHARLTGDSNFVSFKAAAAAADDDEAAAADCFLLHSDSFAVGRRRE